MKSFFQVPENSNLPHISDFDFTTNDIEGAIKELKANSAPGLDGFWAKRWGLRIEADVPRDLFLL